MEDTLHNGCVSLRPLDDARKPIGQILSRHDVTAVVEIGEFAPCGSPATDREKSAEHVETRDGNLRFTRSGASYRRIGWVRGS